MDMNYYLIWDYVCFYPYTAVKDFDQFDLKNEMKELELNKLFAHKVFGQLEVWEILSDMEERNKEG